MWFVKMAGPSYHKRGHATIPPLVNKTPPPFLNPGSASAHSLLLFFTIVLCCHVHVHVCGLLEQYTHIHVHTRAQTHTCTCKVLGMHLCIHLGVTSHTHANNCPVIHQSLQ